MPPGGTQGLNNTDEEDEQVSALKSALTWMDNNRNQLY